MPMQVSINDTAVDVPAPAGLVVNELIEALSVHIEPGEVVTEIEIDGGRFLAGDWELSWRPVQPTSTCRITTVSGRVLGESLRADVAGALGVVAAKATRVVELLNRGASLEAQGVLGTLLEELKLTLVLDAHASQLVGQAPVTSADALESVASELLGAQEDLDHRRLARAIEGDLVPRLTAWRDEIVRHLGDTGSESRPAD